MSTSSRKPGRSRRNRGRPSRRTEEHHVAQAEAEESPAQDVIAHPLVPADEPEMISDAGELDALIRHVRDVGSFAYDTEFIGEETYHPRFCVIQIATREHVALVDPLSDLDITPIWEIIADPELETIVHAGQQDLEPVARYLDRAPANVFDTQIAAGFADRPYPLGLRKLVAEFMGVRLGKALTFTKWDQRPLSKVHARYAADDVRYLPAVREVLRKRLDEIGYTAWVQEECAELSEIERYRFDPDSRVARLLANRSLRPRGRSLLKALVILRDEGARAQDVPPRTLLRDDVLIRLAKDPVKSEARLDTVKGLPRPVRERYGEAIIEATRLVLEEPADRLGRSRMPEETSADRMRIDSLWSLASSYCLGRSIDPSLVTNRRNIALLYYASLNGNTGGDPLSRTNLTSGWRRELVGEMLQDLLAGKTRVELEWSGGQLRASAGSGTPAPAAAVSPSTGSGPT